MREEGPARTMLDWTVALLFRPDVTKVDLAPVADAGTAQRADRPPIEARDRLPSRGAAAV